VLPIAFMMEAALTFETLGLLSRDYTALLPRELSSSLVQLFYAKVSVADIFLPILRGNYVQCFSPQFIISNLFIEDYYVRPSQWFGYIADKLYCFYFPNAF
jgi:hypothetical protein